MPTKRRTRKKEESDNEVSEWEQDTSEATGDEVDEDSAAFELEDNSFEADNPDYHEEDETPAHKPRKRPPPKRTQRRLESSDEEANLLPTRARMTARGGYAHTKKSKSRISRANRGNTPWNKGKNRSDAVRAKISAGVRARNRAILLKKLSKLGMSEEEYHEKRKQVTRTRERLRVIKQKKAKKICGPKPATVSDDMEASPTDEMVATSAEEEALSGERKDPTPLVQPITPPSFITKLPSIFAPHVEWTKHEFDDEPKGAYQARCLSGGPGGLICCLTCMQSYSKYMSLTAGDMEKCRAENSRREATELLAFVKESRVALQKHVNLARRQPPPPIFSYDHANLTGSSRRSTRRTDRGTAALPSEWNATSSIDIGALGPSMHM